MKKATQQAYRVYVDTSVYGGIFDEEFQKDTEAFFFWAEKNKTIFLVSSVLINELSKAPKNVQEYFELIPANRIEEVSDSKEIEYLAGKYIERKIVSAKSTADCTHIATASVARADAIVSWNFKHIVRFDLIKKYNQVNFELGYGIITIVDPRGVSYEIKEDI